MKEETLIEYAAAHGFAGAAVVDTEDIVFDPAFRPYCIENRKEMCYNPVVIRNAAAT